MSSSKTPMYQGIALSVNSNNAQFGDRIVVTLAGRGAAHVAWSTGPDFHTSSGISIQASAGTNSVPVTNFSISNEVVTFLLSSSDSGTGAAFTVASFLVADPDLTEFTLSLTSDQNSTVFATLPMRQPVQLGPSPTIFDWSPT